ncbi:hypothetical protein TOPH_03211 [Tolypocladium ophioglossoides CBS 100239]|uniref:SSCRP protein n=1 Tax=Tolypocladium ophioglossoides (strain CBS 100239) TaxID=1163406 RepID=A0A0L0NF96_TOLOC|nr:hypothetical protein TOPH_03211 [Tolypocladium ophioglossoides CBS 100239]
MRFTTTSSVLAALGLASLAAALDAVQIVQQIAPDATSCPSPPGDCRTAAQAAPFIARSMHAFGVGCPNEMASVVALMAFESVGFKYKHNVFPGRPGQGTANMQMAKYNLLYAKAIPAVEGNVTDIASVDGLPDDRLNWILSLVTPDEYNFGSGPWFLTTQCGADVRAKLQSNVDDGFQAYMQCVGVTVTDERKAYFDRAKKAFGVV